VFDIKWEVLTHGDEDSEATLILRGRICCREGSAVVWAAPPPFSSTHSPLPWRAIALVALRTDGSTRRKHATLTTPRIMTTYAQTEDVDESF
jgi:hypothetical protein